MLGKKARQHNTTERQSNTIQHNSPKTVIFKEKNCLGWDSNPRHTHALTHTHTHTHAHTHYLDFLGLKGWARGERDDRTFL